MRDLKIYLINPFDNVRIGFDDMAAFTTDHIGNLNSRNGDGRWTERLEATTAAMAVFDDAISNNITKGNFRMARTRAKRKFREGLPAAVREIVNWVVAAFGEGSEEVTSVMATPSTAIRKIPDDGVDNFLQSLVAGLTPLVGNGIEQERLDDAVALAAEWDAIYAASEQSTADKQLADAKLRSSKAALARTLFTTLQEISMAHPGEPERIRSYFTQSLAGGPNVSG